MKGISLARQTFQREIETTKSVARQRIGPALKNDGVGLVGFHHFAHHWLEDCLIGIIVDAIAQREIHRIVFAPSSADVLNSSPVILLSLARARACRRTRRSPVPGKYSPNL